MAPKCNFRPSGARATLIAFIAISVVALMTTTVSAQCDCPRVKVINYGALCYPNWYSTLSSQLPVTSFKYTISCQKRGRCIWGKCWWNKIYYRGSYCYVNDYYVDNGCLLLPCLNIPTCL